MKRVIIIALAGLVAGLGGGTGIAVMTAPKGVDGASHAVADSTVEVAANEKGITPDGPGHAASSLADSGDAQAGNSLGAEPAPGAADGTPVTAAEVTQRTAAGDVPTAIAESIVADSAAAVQLRRISRTFANMSPREAAKVLELMEDADVNAILGSLNEKQGAVILAAFPPARAAAISRQRLNAARMRTP